MSYIPKVGEDCICTHNNFNCKVTPDFVGKELVVFTYEGDEVPLSIECFKPIKTPAEIERDELQSVIKNAMRLQTNHLEETLAYEIYDAGYRKQQVKPLSKSYALDEVGITGNNYRFMVAHGFIVQGGE